MYKKITHNIVEEHFDHPLANQIKKSITRSTLPSTQIFDKFDFRTTLTVAMNNIANKLNLILDGVNTNEVQVVEAFEGIFADINAVSELSKHFFPTEFCERLTQSLRGWAIYSLMMIHKAKIGQDYLMYKNGCNRTSAELVQTFSDFDSAMPILSFQPSLNSISTNILAKVDALVANNTEQANIANNSLINDFRTFGNAYANGIMAKFPERFTGI
jgi:hypothetical protein